MSISSSALRLTEYYRRHGFADTIRRAGIAAKQAIVAGRMVVLYCDISVRNLPQAGAVKALRVERIQALNELSAEHLQVMMSLWNPKLANRNIRERFENGALLWLVEYEEQLAGYGWTSQGQTIAPYYFPLGPDDVHFFDFHVFPHYRGRGINPYLIGQVLDGLAANCTGRAFIEAAEWNAAQLSSLRKTPFRYLGSVRSFTIFHRTFVSWMRGGPLMQAHKGSEGTDRVLRTARSKD